MNGFLTNQDGTVLVLPCPGGCHVYARVAEDAGDAENNPWRMRVTLDDARLRRLATLRAVLSSARTLEATEAAPETTVFGVTAAEAVLDARGLMSDYDLAQFVQFFSPGDDPCQTLGATLGIDRRGQVRVSATDRWSHHGWKSCAINLDLLLQATERAAA